LVSVVELKRTIIRELHELPRIQKNLMPETISAAKAVSEPLLEEASFLPSPKQFFALLLLYLGLHLIFRTLVSETAGIDEAHQLVLGQKFQRGYGPHAPLYTWLMILFLHVFGWSESSLTLLRELLLFSTYTLTYFNARELTRSHACGILAAIALQFHPSIFWESQRELTNSIVASTMVLATLLSFLRIRPDRWGAWIAFGLFGGLTILSKYNAGIFYGAMLIAVLTIPNLRRQMLNWRLAVAILVSLAVVAPNAYWAYAHRDLTLSLTYKFGIHESMPWFQSVRTGLVNWFVAVAAHVAPVVAIFAAILWRPIFPERCLKLHSEKERFLWHTLLIVFGIGIIVVLFKVTEFKDRWLQPLFIATPILVVVAVRNGLNRARLKTLSLLALAIACIVVILAPGRLFLTERRGQIAMWIRIEKEDKPHRDILNAPFRKIAADLKSPAENADFILSGTYWVGGNLRLWFSDKHIFSPDLAPPDINFPGQKCLMVWNAEQRTEPPEPLVQFAKAFTGGSEKLTPTFIEEKWKYHQNKMMRIGWLVLERNGPKAEKAKSN
jgi:lipopolysaccharide core galacturonosyltransferase RgtB